MTTLDAVRKQYQKALGRFEEILKEKKSVIIRDSAIKRFEFTFDLAWKLIKAYLKEEKGVTCRSPKDCFREAFRQGLIDYDDLWIKMTDWRNEAVHTYSEEFADALYRKLAKVFQCFKNLEEGFSENKK